MLLEVNKVLTTKGVTLYDYSPPVLTLFTCWSAAWSGIAKDIDYVPMYIS